MGVLFFFHTCPQRISENNYIILIYTHTHTDTWRTYSRRRRPTPSPRLDSGPLSPRVRGAGGRADGGAAAGGAAGGRGRVLLNGVVLRRGRVKEISAGRWT